MNKQATRDTLTHMVEWDIPFRVNGDGTVDTFVDGDAPTVYHDAEEDVIVDGAGDWTPLTGYTGQDSYHGAVMHPSEQLSGGLADDVLATPGVYVLTTVLDMEAAEDDALDSIIGWSILRSDND